MSDQVILHHYWPSPVAQKVRSVLGMKDLAWRSVEIPRVPPKPDLMPLTGGYRRTPVLQIGADIYCDSQCIIRELERRFPNPTLYPNDTDGIAWAVSRWADTSLFNHCVAVVLGHQLEKLPTEFAGDRFRLYFGPNYDAATIAADLPHHLAQVRSQLGWLEQRLATGARFLMGDAPGLADAVAYHLVWFVRGRYAEGEPFLREFEHLGAWEKRIEAIGHGQPTEMTSVEALEAARSSTASTGERTDPADPQGLTPGDPVAVVPADDGGDPPVLGEVVVVSADTIAIRREAPETGEVVVHFPRAGYRVSRR